MKRLRLSTLMLLVAIAALGITVLVQNRQAAVRDQQASAREAALQVEIQNQKMLREFDRQMRNLQKQIVARAPPRLALGLAQDEDLVLAVAAVDLPDEAARTAPPRLAHGPARAVEAGE